MSVISILAGQNRTIINDVSESKQGTLGKIKKYVRQSLGFITGIVVDATMSEIHSRRSEITLNPIEDGESVADHVNLNTRA